MGMAALACLADKDSCLAYKDLYLADKELGRADEDSMNDTNDINDQNDGNGCVNELNCNSAMLVTTSSSFDAKNDVNLTELKETTTQEDLVLISDNIKKTVNNVNDNNNDSNQLIENNDVEMSSNNLHTDGSIIHDVKKTIDGINDNISDSSNQLIENNNVQMASEIDGRNYNDIERMQNVVDSYKSINILIEKSLRNPVEPNDIIQNDIITPKDITSMPDDAHLGSMISNDRCSMVSKDFPVRSIGVHMPEDSERPNVSTEINLVIVRKKGRPKRKFLTDDNEEKGTHDVLIKTINLDGANSPSKKMKKDHENIEIKHESNLLEVSASARPRRYL
jgi:hypothetical protein